MLLARSYVVTSFHQVKEYFSSDTHMYEVHKEILLDEYIDQVPHIMWPHPFTRDNLHQSIHFLKYILKTHTQGALPQSRGRRTISSTLTNPWLVNCRILDLNFVVKRIIDLNQKIVDFLKNARVAMLRRQERSWLL